MFYIPSAIVNPESTEFCGAFSFNITNYSFSQITLMMLHIHIDFILSSESIQLRAAFGSETPNHKLLCVEINGLVCHVDANFKFKMTRIPRSFRSRNIN